MASITITFSAPLNESCQVGDIAHAVSTSSTGGFDTGSGIATIGQIMEINKSAPAAPVIICDTILEDATNVSGKFILFSKDARVNMSSLLGYYAETKFVCTDQDKAELFSIGTDMFESSK